MLLKKIFDYLKVILEGIRNISFIKIEGLTNF